VGYICETKQHMTLHTTLQHREFSAVVFPYLAHDMVTQWVQDLATTLTNSVHQLTDASIRKMLIHIQHDNQPDMTGCPVMLLVHLMEVHMRRLAVHFAKTVGINIIC